MVANRPRLRRVLTLADLVLYGVIVVSPVASMMSFGILMQRGSGHAVSSILIAMLAMLLTAVSYGRMARAYPSAGSAFTYVGREISPILGYVTGWSMVMDYLLGPLVNVLWCSQQAHVLLPVAPYWGWVILFASLITVLNLQGVKVSAAVNIVLAAGMMLVVAAFVIGATLYVSSHPHDAGGYFFQPLYDPRTWSMKGLLSGTSLAVLTYIGFDGISTLSEEAKRPGDVLPATVLTCLAIGLVSALQVYGAQLVWPISEHYPNVDTAFTFVAARVWAPLFGIVGLTLIVACIGSGMGMQLGAARLLYGMGRGGALPEAFFGALDPKRHVPRNNVLLVGALALAGALILPEVPGQTTGFDLGASLLNFGALLSFMGVNLAAFMRYFWRAGSRNAINLVLPVLGFLVCLLLWWNLGTQARTLGITWIAIGVAYGAWRTRGFRANLVNFV